MRKNVIFSLILAVCVIVLSFACVKTDVTVAADGVGKTDKVLTVAKNNNVEDPVLESRFLNMLNHNFVYDDAFYNDADLVNNSVLALLDLADGSYIAESYVRDYIFNMYGKIYEDLGAEDGMLYIAPRGYSLYSHEIANITANADGSYTVITDVTISYEDGSEETLKAETLFIKAADSAFGYNMLYSDIIEVVINTADC